WQAGMPAPQVSASRLTLLRRIASREGELHRWLAFEFYRSKECVDFVASDRNIDRGRRPRGASPFDRNVFGSQVRRDGFGVGCGMGIAIDHHVANGGSALFDVLRRGGAKGSESRVPAAVAYGRHQLIVDIEAVSELERPCERGYHHAGGESQF